MKSFTIIAIALLCFSIFSCKKDNIEHAIIEPEIIVPEQQVLNWFNSMQLQNGLVPSSTNSNVSLYDNALSAMVFMIYNENDRAEKIFDFFNDRIDSEFRKDSGGFAQFRYKNGTPIDKHQWMGDNAWLLIALNNYKHKTGSVKYDRLAAELGSWLIGLRNEEGGLYGGYDGTNRINLLVTEGIIDAFNAVPGYTDFHKKILQFLEKERWDINKSSLTTGWIQYNYALDLHPWSYCIFDGFPTATLNETEMYIVTKTVEVSGNKVTGYCFDLDKDNIWFEGVGEMVVAFNEAKLNDKASFYLNELEKAMVKSTVYNGASGIPYASNGNSTRYGDGVLYEPEYTEPFVSSNAWYLFGVKKFNPFGIERSKMIPEVDKFWNP